MRVSLNIGVLWVGALLSSILLVAGCTQAPPNSPPAPISGSQDLRVPAGPQPTAAAQSHNRAALRSPRHAAVGAAPKLKRHASILSKSRARAKTAKRTPHVNPTGRQTNATERETAANAGAVHHIGPKVIPLD